MFAVLVVLLCVDVFVLSCLCLRLLLFVSAFVVDGVGCCCCLLLMSYGVAYVCCLYV